jgi:hypothetical protein
VHEPRDVDRRRRASESFRVFCDAYFPQTFHLAWFAGGVEAGTPGEYWADTVLGSVALPTQAQYLSPAPFSSSGGEFSGTTSVRGYAVTSELAICRWDVGGGMQFVD